MHLAAGRYYGKDSTCGPDDKPKIRHSTEESANKHAHGLNKRISRSHDVEAYPCPFCNCWHVGRVMEEYEREVFSDPVKAEYLGTMETLHIDAADPLFGIQQGIVGLKVHNRKLCEGQPCSIHHPSDHHMTQFPLNWRGDRRIMERICPHGIGHPDPDDATFRKQRDSENYDTGVHGCDGCCSTRR